MSAGGPGQGAPAGAVGPWTAVAFAATAYLALVVLGWGMLSLALGEDVIETRGLGPLPGAVSLGSSVVVLALTLRSALRVPRPSFWNAAWIAAAVFVTSVVAVGATATAGGTPIGEATGVAARFATTWVGAVVAAAALVCAWGGIALVRTRARRPRWPWEDEED